MDHKGTMGMGAVGEVDRNAGMVGGIGLKTHYKIECFDKDGNEKWVEEFDNRVVNTGLDDNLDKYFKTAGGPVSYYVGLTDGAPLGDAQTDTLASKAWSEVVPYSDATRPALVLGTVSGQSIDNSASKAVFNINATATVGGAFLAQSSTKSETASLLYGVGAFAADKSVTSGDTLNVTITLTAATA